MLYGEWVFESRLKEAQLCSQISQVITLSNITTSDGKKHFHESYLGQCGNRLRDNLEWHRVPSTLSRPFVAKWKEVLRELFTIPYANENNRRLPRELGPWTDPNVEEKWI